MSDDRRVKVTLVIDETGAVRSLKATGDESEHAEHKIGNLDKSVKGLGSSFSGLKGMIAGGLGALGAGGLVFGLADIANKTKEIAEETEKFSSISGIGATASLRYTAALKARGISGEAAGNAFKFLAKNVQTAERQEHTYGLARAKSVTAGKVMTTQLGVQAEAFQRLGINLGQFNSLSEEDKLSLVVARFSKMKDGAEKTRLAVQLFGRGATALIPVLKGGALGLQHNYEMAKKFFPTLKGEGTQAMNELLQKQAEGKMAWEGLEFTLGTKLAPVMSEVFGEMSKGALEIEKGTGIWGELEHGVEGVVNVGGKAVSILKEVAKFVGIKLDGGTLGVALTALGAADAAKHIPGLRGHKGAGLIGKAAGVAGTAAEFGAGAALGSGGYTGAAKWAFRLGRGVSYAPEAGALGAGASLPFLSAKGIHAGVEALSPGYLKRHSLAEVEALAPGSAAEADALRRKAGYLGATRLGGRAAGHAGAAGEASLVSRLLEHPGQIAGAAKGLTANEVEQISSAFLRAHQAVPHELMLRVSGDTALAQAIATAIRLDPVARRELAEGVAQQVAGSTARK